jgi:hypothetical protein
MVRIMGSVRLPTDDPEAVPPVPLKVSRMQARRALQAEGLLEGFEAAIAASGDEDLKIYYADSSDFYRNHPTLTAFMTARGLTDAQIDNLFRAAALLA